jgi:hypothetical protein
MRYFWAAAIVLSLMLGLCWTASAVFFLDPEKDMKVTEKKVVNGDGTTSIKEEVVITKSELNVTTPEEVTSSSKKKKVTHARGWEKKQGTFRAGEPMFTVVKTRPKDWPIPETKGRAKEVPAAAVEEETRTGIHWLVSLVCLGVIAFALFKLIVYMREVPDPNRA